MSNLADFLKDITLSNSEAINLAGDMLGTLADLGGGISVIGGVLDSFLSQNNQDLTDIRLKLQEIEDKLNEKFAQLHAEQRAAHILDRLRDLDPAIGKAQSVYDELSTILHTVPPVSEEFRLTQIGFCLEAVDELDVSDAKWQTVFQDEIYYGQDGGDGFAGVVAPEADSNGLVFSDRYILPFFLMTLNIFMTVTAALEPDYQIKFADPLRRYASRLQKVHDISKAGIVAMRRPTRDEILQRSASWDANWYGIFDTAPGSLRELCQPYGVIYIYSGYRSVSFFPQLPFFPPSSDGLGGPGEQLLAEVNAKLNFAIEREWKKTYVAIGLRDVRNAIGHLRNLLGNPPSPGVDPSAWWSLSETYKLLGLMAPTTSTGAPDFSAFKMVSAMATLGGLSAERPVSWRRSLSALLAASTTSFDPASLGFGPF